MSPKVLGCDERVAVNRHYPFRRRGCFGVGLPKRHRRRPFSGRSWCCSVLCRHGSHRQLVDHDGVAYLDIAERYAQGPWTSAINGFYSPLYSWLMAIGLYLLQVPRYSEATLLHPRQFCCYLGAYASFEFFLGEVIREQRANANPQDQATGLSEPLGTHSD